jgi:adenosylcobinamide kinase / adenosylcobinamide-phosphate guanylyltransferase
MALVLLLGGARAGKSALAVRLAGSWGGPVVVLATGEAGDAEMAERIERHRRERPSGWTTVEEPIELEAALERMPEDACVILDCLTLWVSNLLERGRTESAVEQEAARVARIAAARPAPTLIVSNEVGLGVVPTSPLGRAYRDLLGRVNALVAEAATESLLVVAGRLVRLEPVSNVAGLELR